MYKETSEGTEAFGLRMTKAGKEQIVEADVYVAALDVPGVPSLLLLCTRLCDAFYAAFASYHAQCTLAITSSAKHSSLPCLCAPVWRRSSRVGL